MTSWHSTISTATSTRRPRNPTCLPASYSTRAPGAGQITLSNIRASSNEAAPNQPVKLSVDVSGTNIGYMYLFVGYFDPSSNSLNIADTDYLESPDTKQVGGVYYPVWKEGAFTMNFTWDPIVFGISDGTPERGCAVPAGAIWGDVGGGRVHRGRPVHLYRDRRDALCAAAFPEQQTDPGGRLHGRDGQRRAARDHAGARATRSRSTTSGWMWMPTAR